MKEEAIPKFPELGTAPVGIEPYISADYFELERERVFRRSWLYVAREEELADTGDYLVRDLAVAKASLLLVRGGDGQIRAFHNICRHRGNKLVRAHNGGARYFTCGFHGWVYDLGGNLVKIVDEPQFYGINKAEISLVQVHAQSWQGFIFVNLAPRPAETLHQWVGEIADQYDHYFDHKTLLSDYRAVVACNWKVALDSFDETYHVPTLHRHSIPDVTFNPNRPPRFLNAEVFKRTHRWSLYGNPEHKPTYAEGIAINFGPSTFLVSNDRSKSLPEGVNPTRDPNWAFDIFVIFPNFMCLTGDGWYWPIEFWPLDSQHTLISQRIYHFKPANAGERISQEFMRTRSRDIVREDLNTLENIQASLNSRAIPHLYLSEQEVLIRHRLKIISDMVSAPK
jgi:glycine betaine catabolism A